MTTTNERNQPPFLNPRDDVPLAPAAPHEQIVIHVTERAPGGGRWVTGTVQDHTFCAKVYARHALCPSFQLEASRISKLEVRQLDDGEKVVSFDRGWDVPAVYQGGRTSRQDARGFLGKSRFSGFR